MQRILFLANISNAIYKSSNLFTEAKIFDEGEELLLNIFPHSLSSSWPGVTLTMHTMIADEKPVDLCPLFIDAHNSKVPLSAYRWCVMRGPEPYFDAVKGLCTATHLGEPWHWPACL